MISGFANPWSLVLSVGIPLIIIGVTGFALVVVIRLGLSGRRSGHGALQAELTRIDERLTSIEKMLRDID
jgi:hypothetical protein